MPSVKRDKLLSGKERERLIERETSKDKRLRATNDVRVKRKLSAWLDSLEDISLVLKHLPPDQWLSIIPSLNDDQVATLFRLTEKLMNLLGYYGIEGSWQDRSSWQVTRGGFDDRGFPIPASTPRAATEKDIRQSLIVDEHRLALDKHRTGDKIIAYQYIPGNNEKDTGKWKWETLERNYWVTQNYDPALMIGYMARYKDISAFPNWTPEALVAIDEVADILRSIKEPKFKKEEPK